MGPSRVRRLYGTAGMASYNNPVYGGAAPAGADGGYLGAGNSTEYGAKPAKKKGALSGKSPCAKKGKSSSAVRCCALQKNTKKYTKKIQPNKQSRGTHNTIEMPLSLSL